MELNPALDHTDSNSLITEDTGVLWKQLFSLATLYASVIIGWIAYYNYQPILLETYNFTDLTDATANWQQCQLTWWPNRFS